MFELSKIEFIESYLCELNSDRDMPLISNYNVEQDDDITLTFIENTIYNLYSSKDMKWARFVENDELCSKAYKYIIQISDDLSLFKQNSINIVNEYFKIVRDNVPVQSGDLIVVLFEMQKEIYLGVFKYNHKTMLISQVDVLNDSNNIYISQKSSLFTSNKHKADEGFIVNLMSLDIALVDKKYEINAEKSNILQDNILLLQTERSEKEKLEVFSKVTKNLEQKYIGDDLEQKAKIKKAIKDTVLDDGVITVDSFVEKAFEDTQQLKKIYEVALEKSGIQKQDKIEVPDRLLKTKFQRQKITTETGIEINVPIDYYGDESKIQFIPDDNGTMSIVIKNIKNIST